jgi:hypothetical protein
VNRAIELPRGGLLAIVAVVAALTAACSASPPPTGGSAGPASGGASAGSAGANGGGPPPAAKPELQQKVLAYTECMRSHGVPMPILPVLPAKPSGRPTAQPVKANGPGPDSPQFQSAQHACRSLLPPSTKGGPASAGAPGG